MTTKFHINQKGLPSICQAKTRPCPFGGEEAHYSSYEEAQAAASQIMQDKFGFINVPDLRVTVSADEFKTLVSQLKSEDKTVHDVIVDGGDLSELEMEDVSMYNVEFKKTKMRRTEFVNSVLEDVKFTGCDIRYMNTEGSTLNDCRFETTDAYSSKFIGNTFRNVVFTGCDLEAANFTRSQLYDFEVDTYSITVDTVWTGTHGKNIKISR